MNITFPISNDPATQERTIAAYKILFCISLSDKACQDIKKYINEGVCTESYNDNGYTLLHCAVVSGKIEIVDLLLDKGASLGAEDNQGNTPLHVLANNRYGKEMCLFLINKGADLNTINKRGKTVLHLALLKDSHEIVRLLINGTENLNQQDYITGSSPLHIAARGNMSYIIPFLLSGGANPELREWDGQTALYALAQEQSSKITVKAAQNLLNYGANIHALTNLGEGINIEDISRPIAKAKELYKYFVSVNKAPQELKQVYQLLSVWPLADPKAPVDRAAHIRQIFTHAKWQSKEAAEKIAQGLLEDKQIDPVQSRALVAAAFPEQQQHYNSAVTVRGMGL